MSASSAPTTQILWLSWPTDEAIAPRFMPKPCTKAVAMIVVDAVARDDRDLDDVLAEIDAALAVVERQRHAERAR